MRYIHHDGNYIVFFCDHCGKVLDNQDDGQPYWEDYDRFVEDTQAGKEDCEEVKFLCLTCFEKADGYSQSWYDTKMNDYIKSIWEEL